MVGYYIITIFSRSVRRRKTKRARESPKILITIQAAERERERESWDGGPNRYWRYEFFFYLRREEEDGAARAQLGEECSQVFYVHTLTRLAWRKEMLGVFGITLNLLLWYTYYRALLFFSTLSVKLCPQLSSYLTFSSLFSLSLKENKKRRRNCTIKFKSRRHPHERSTHFFSFRIRRYRG